MVGFYNQVGGTGLVNVVTSGNNQLAFERQGKGFVAINNSDGVWNVKFNTGLPKGTYCDVVSGAKVNGKCTGKSYVTSNFIRWIHSLIENFQPASRSTAGSKPLSLLVGPSLFTSALSCRHSVVISRSLSTRSGSICSLHSLIHATGTALTIMDVKLSSVLNLSVTVTRSRDNLHVHRGKMVFLKQLAPFALLSTFFAGVSAATKGDLGQLHASYIKRANAGSGVIKLTAEDFETITAADREWSVAVQLTAMGNEFKCAPCK